MAKKTNNNRLYFILLILISLAAGIAYAVFSLRSSQNTTISISCFALLAGVIYEHKKLCTKWATVIYTVLGAFALSFSAFLPGKREHSYILDTHIVMWPYFFIGFVILISLVINNEKTIARLGEGITLLQSIALIYWIIDYDIEHTSNLLLLILLSIGVIYVLYTLYHAFTYSILSRTSRLHLSIWSSVIMMILAADNIYSIYQNPPIEAVTDGYEKLNVGLQYFLLGTCSIYIAQNVLMILGFLPGKGTFFNAQYFKDVRELKNNHVNRYSKHQVHIFHSVVAVLFASAIFSVNFHYHFFPKNIAIWTVFLAFPLIMRLLPGRKDAFC